MSYHTELNQALKKRQFRSLKEFFEQNSFSFSYEYLRQIFLGEKIPTTAKLQEIGSALGMDAKKLLKAAVETRIDRTIKKHYQRPLQSPSSILAEKTKKLANEDKKESKIVKAVSQLDDKEKDQVLTYLKFLKQQWRVHKK